MFATTGIIQENTVLEEDKPFETISDDKFFAASDALISQNMEAYNELAKCIQERIGKQINLMKKK